MSDEQQAPAAAPPAVPGVHMSIDNYMDIILSATLRGAVLGLQPHPPQVVMMSACRIMALLIGASFIGDPASVKAARESCRAVFNSVLDTAPEPQPVPPPPNANGSGAHHGGELA